MQKDADVGEQFKLSSTNTAFQWHKTASLKNKKSCFQQAPTVNRFQSFCSSIFLSWAMSTWNNAIAFTAVRTVKSCLHLEEFYDVIEELNFRSLTDKETLAPNFK